MENNPKIITKKASRVRFTVSNALGGIGWPELFIIFVSVVMITLSLTLLAKISMFAGIITTVMITILTIFFISPNKNGDKLYYVIFIAIVFLFKSKKHNIENNNKVQIIKNRVAFHNGKQVLIYKINAVDLTLSTQEERNMPIYDFSNYMRALNFDFEIIKIDSNLNFDKNKNYLTRFLKQDSLKNSQKQQLNNFNSYVSSSSLLFLTSCGVGLLISRFGRSDVVLASNETGILVTIAGIVNKLSNFFTFILLHETQYYHQTLVSMTCLLFH